MDEVTYLLPNATTLPPKYYDLVIFKAAVAPIGTK